MKRVLDLASPERSAQRDRLLGATLAFIAGATNAGGFLAVAQYTSHMTGIVSGLAGDVALGNLRLALSALASIVAFVAGAMTTSIAVNWGRRRELRALFAIPLLFEAALLLCFGLLGGALSGYTALVAPATVLLLCFLMGLQNAVITKISRAEIRTTHVTGLVTDIGIEIGRMVYVNRGGAEPVRVNRERLGVHLLLFTSFLVGGIAGAIGFEHVGYVTTVPLAVILIIIGLKPVAADLREAF